MKEYKRLLIGIGSSNDLPDFDRVRLDGMKIEDWMADKSIYVFRDPMILRKAVGVESRMYDPLITSMDRRPNDLLGYARDIEQMSSLGYRIAALFYGGLGFATPRVFASGAFNVPVIGVGIKGQDVPFTSMYYTPNGTPIGIVESGNLEKGFRLANMILSLPKDTPVNLVSHGSDEVTEEIKSLLERTVGKYNLAKENNTTYEGITIFLSRNPHEFAGFDKKVEIGIFGLEEDLTYKSLMNESCNLNHSFIIGRPQNLALFAARILAMNNKAVNVALYSYNEEIREKANRRITAIQPDDFKLPKKITS